MTVVNDCAEWVLHMMHESDQTYEKYIGTVDNHGNHGNCSDFRQMP